MAIRGRSAFARRDSKGPGRNAPLNKTRVKSAPDSPDVSRMRPTAQGGSVSAIGDIPAMGKIILNIFVFLDFIRFLRFSS